MKINKRLWGKHDGKKVFLFEMECAGGIKAVVSNYGGILQSLIVRDQNENETDIVLGYDTLAEYEASDAFFGAMIGPVADRLIGGQCVLEGTTVILPQNAGCDCLHSGPNGFHSRVWNCEVIDESLVLSYSFSGEESGFPGTLDVTIRYLITQSNVLRIEYAAVCDRETAVSFTNHSYFNLVEGKQDIRKHRITVCADTYAETQGDREAILTGFLRDVEKTIMDLREGREIDEILDKNDFPEIRRGDGLDHYFIVNGEGMREHAILEESKSGLILRCRSDAPGVLVYTANGLIMETGKRGKVYGKNWGICLETQRFPNAVNFPHLRKEVLLSAGQLYKTSTEFEVFQKQG